MYISHCTNTSAYETLAGRGWDRRIGRRRIARRRVGCRRVGRRRVDRRRVGHRDILNRYIVTITSMSLLILEITTKQTFAGKTTIHNYIRNNNTCNQ